MPHLCWTHCSVHCCLICSAWPLSSISPMFYEQLLRNNEDPKNAKNTTITWLSLWAFGICTKAPWKKLVKSTPGVVCSRSGITSMPRNTGWETLYYIDVVVLPQMLMLLSLFLWHNFSYIVVLSLFCNSSYITILQ